MLAIYTGAKLNANIYVYYGLFAITIDLRESTGVINMICAWEWGFGLCGKLKIVLHVQHENRYIPVRIRAQGGEYEMSGTNKIYFKGIYALDLKISLMRFTVLFPSNKLFMFSM